MVKRGEALARVQLSYSDGVVYQKTIEKSALVSQITRLKTSTDGV